LWDYRWRVLINKKKNGELVARSVYKPYIHEKSDETNALYIIEKREKKFYFIIL